jgi:hypothetical protein
LALFLQNHLNENPLPAVPAESQEESQVEEAPDLCLKRVLIWSHHLLAISKRKDIVNWASELQLWGYSKPG